MDYTLGNAYTSGNLCFFRNSFRLLSPIGNRINLYNFENNTLKQIRFQAHADITYQQVCNRDRLLVVADAHNYAHLFNLPKQRKIASLRFKQPISKIRFSHNNNVFVLQSGRYLYIYQTPKFIGAPLHNGFVLLKKYNSKSESRIPEFKFTRDDRFIVYCTQAHSIFVVNVFPQNVQYPQFELMGHKSEIADFHVGLQNAGEIISADKSGKVIWWKLKNEQ